MPTTFCVECGQPIPEGSAFCPQCGTPAAGKVAPTVSPSPPLPNTVPVQPTAIPPLSVYQRPPSNGMATAGFVLSLVSLFLGILVIPVALGIIFSSIGISRARMLEQTTGQPIGRGLAAAGLVISLLIAFGGLVLFVSVI